MKWGSSDFAGFHQVPHVWDSGNPYSTNDVASVHLGVQPARLSAALTMAASRAATNLRDGNRTSGMTAGASDSLPPTPSTCSVVLLSPW